MKDNVVKFRETIRKSVEYVRLKYDRRWYKSYWNAGFFSQEEMDLEKRKALEKARKIDESMDCIIGPGRYTTHEGYSAYYIMKHNLDKDEAETYILRQCESRKDDPMYLYYKNASIDSFRKVVNMFLKEFGYEHEEKAVCAD